MSSIQIFLFITLLLATLIDLIVPVIIGKKYPDYNHFKDTISTLGTKTSPVQREQSRTLIIVGGLFIIYSTFQWIITDEKITAHHWYFIGIIIYGIGCIFAGLYSEDPKGVKETVSGKIHGIASGIGFIFLILSLFWNTKIPELHDFQSINILLVILAILTFLAFLISGNINSGILCYTGLFQRLNLIIMYFGLVLNCVWMLRS